MRRAAQFPRCVTTTKNAKKNNITRSKNKSFSIVLMLCWYNIAEFILKVQRITAWGSSRSEWCYSIVLYSEFWMNNSDSNSDSEYHHTTIASVIAWYIYRNQSSSTRICRSVCVLCIWYLPLNVPRDPPCMWTVLCRSICAQRSSKYLSERT